MGKSKKTHNKMNRSGIEMLKKRLEQALPYPSLKRAARLVDPGPLRLSGAAEFKNNFEEASVEVRAGDANLRIYRKADKADGDWHHYDVDEIRHANAPVITYPNKSAIADHHLGSIPEDQMRRNNLTIDVVDDGYGSWRPNVQLDGTVPALINFEESIPLDKSTPDRQTWFCRTCRKRQQMHFAFSPDPVILTYILRASHLSVSPECAGDLEVLIADARS